MPLVGLLNFVSFTRSLVIKFWATAIVDGEEYTTTIPTALPKHYLPHTHGMLFNNIQGIALG